ncbi:MAG: hypothetical protein P1U68_02780 [Verrucomicrobiales bacterium]|nr:hypothetical protein [Verrucomicrobiales bacterium]
MKTTPLNPFTLIIPAIAALSFFVASPVHAGGYGEPIVKKVKVKDHKVKVKTVGGKAKIKNKGYGKQKVKVKGWSGDYASSIAREAAGGPRHGGHPHGK